MTVVATESAHPPATVSWSSLIGHDLLSRWIASAIRSNRMGGSFLLVGMPGVGKRTIARLIALTLLCETNAPALMNPCGTCSSCQQVIAGTHPDLVRLSKPADKSFIPLEQLIGPPEARMQSGFCRDLRLRPMMGTRKVAVLEDADFLNEEGANCLLKTLEEPPSGAVVLLLSTSEQRQLPTIRSRCQIIRVGPLAIHDATRLIREVHGIEADDDQIAKAVQVAAGDMNVAVRLLDDDAGEFRDSMIAQLAEPNPDPAALARLITIHVEKSGKDASKRRSAMRDVMATAIQHFRAELRAEASANAVLAATIARLDRSIRAMREIDRNANQSTLIECYASDIASAVTADRGDIG